MHGVDKYFEQDQVTQDVSQRRSRVTEVLKTDPSGHKESSAIVKDRLRGRYETRTKRLRMIGISVM